MHAPHQLLALPFQICCYKWLLYYWTCSFSSLGLNAGYSPPTHTLYTYRYQGLFLIHSLVLILSVTWNASCHTQYTTCLHITPHVLLSLITWFACQEPAWLQVGRVSFSNAWCSVRNSASKIDRDLCLGLYVAFQSKAVSSSKPRKAHFKYQNVRLICKTCPWLEKYMYMYVYFIHLERSAEF